MFWCLCMYASALHWYMGLTLGTLKHLLVLVFMMGASLVIHLSIAKALRGKRTTKETRVVFRASMPFPQGVSDRIFPWMRALLARMPGGSESKFRIDVIVSTAPVFLYNMYTGTRVKVRGFEPPVAP